MAHSPLNLTLSSLPSGELPLDGGVGFAELGAVPELGVAVSEHGPQAPQLKADARPMSLRFRETLEMHPASGPQHESRLASLY